MKVAIIDPSGWTYYYDCILTKALNKYCHVELLTEKFKYDQNINVTSPNTKYMFLRISGFIEEKMKNKKILLFLKGIEYLKDLINVYFYIKKQNFDLIHIQWTPVPLVDIIFIKLIKRNLKIPVIYTAHNVLPHKIKPYDKFIFSKLYKVINDIIVHSKNISTELIDLFNLEHHKIHVIEHPIFNNYYIKNPTKVEARNVLNISPDEKVGLFFGRIDDYKGLEVLLEAIKLLKERGLNIKLIIAGKCDNFQKYQKKIQRFSISDNIIKFTYFIQSSLVEEIFCATDVIILPYIKTYGSGVLLLGIAFSKPAIVTNTGHLPEIIVDGKHGFVVPPGDPFKLAEAIYKFFNLAEDKREKMEEDVNNLKKSFAPDVIAKKTLEVYKNVLQRS